MEFEVQESNRSLTIVVPKPSLKYVDFFIGLRSAPRLLRSGFYPNSKEITESIGVFDTARMRLGLDHRDASIAFVSVGDGFFPRTGLYVAHLTQWQVHSVDPGMVENWDHVEAECREIRNLQLYPSLIEETDLLLSPQTARVVLAFVHSHASLEASVERARLALLTAGVSGVRMDAVSLPCCLDDDLGRPPDEEIENPHILSVHRRVQIYKDVLR
jgi:hypothetical protein